MKHTKKGTKKDWCEKVKGRITDAYRRISSCLAERQQTDANVLGLQMQVFNFTNNTISRDNRKQSKQIGKCMERRRKPM
jgi:hypothetical protein